MSCPWQFCDPDDDGCTHVEPKRGSIVLVERTGNERERRGYYFGKLEPGRYGVLAVVEYLDGSGYMSTVHPSRICIPSNGIVTLKM